MPDLSGLRDSHRYLNRQTNHSMIHDLRIDVTICRSPIIHVCPPKFCITFDFNSSWVLQSPQKKLRTMLRPFFLRGGGGGWGGVQQGVLWEICK